MAYVKHKSLKILAVASLVVIALGACGGGGGGAAPVATSPTTVVATPGPNAITPTSVQTPIPSISTASAAGLSASQIPTTTYVPTDGKLTANFNEIYDVWAAEGIVVAGGGGLGISEDKGANWLAAQSQCRGTTAISPGVILEGGQSGCLVRHTRQGLGKWTSETLSGLKIVHPTLGAPFFLNIQSVARFEGNFYALMSDFDRVATEASVYKSNDGANWIKQTYRFDPSCSLRGIKRTSDGRIFACGKISSDNGTTWDKHPKIFYPAGNAGQLYLADINTDLTITNPGFGTGSSVSFFSSTNQGVSYTGVTSNLASLIGNGKIVSAGVFGSDIVAVSRDEGAKIGIDIVTRIIRSSDGGKTWIKSDAGFKHPSSVISSAAFQGGFADLAINANTIYITGLDWVSKDTFLYSSIDGGKSWSVALKATSYRTNSLWSETGYCYRTETNTGGISNILGVTINQTLTSRSLDGLSWNRVADEALPRSIDISGARFKVASESEISSGILTEGSATVQKYDATTAKWRVVLTSPKPSRVTEVTGADGNLFVAFSSIGQLYKSSDRGETWQLVVGSTVPYFANGLKALGGRALLSVGIPPPCVGACAVLPGFEPSVSVSLDEGITWKRQQEFGVPRSVAVGNGVVVGTRANGLPGLARMEAPYLSAQIIEPTFGSTSDYLFKTVLFEENTFLMSDVNGQLRIGGNLGKVWETVSLEVKEGISNLALCGKRLLLQTSIGAVVSPAVLP